MMLRIICDFLWRSMLLRAIKTHVIQPHDSLETLLDTYVTDLAEQDILVITSKIISVSQGRLVSKSAVSKRALIQQEADKILQMSNNANDLYLTLKEGMLLPSAGIDESNVNDMYVLYPAHVQKTAATLWAYLRQKHAIQHLGILITDSHVTMMRRGVTGVALGWCGYAPLYSYVNTPDICGKSLKVTQINILDSLAASAVFVMGEGAEQTPLAIIKNAPKIHFSAHPPTAAEEASIRIPMAEDLYAPLLMSACWL